MLYEICEIRYVFAPHFHAYYQDEVAIFSFDTVDMPNGADFDPATLHDWPAHAQAWIAKTPRVESNLGVTILPLEERSKGLDWRPFQIPAIR
jgi:hypothetical protein